MFSQSNPLNVIPDYVERKGSLFLRSDHMDYSRPTLVSNWHQAREAEPKDYDLKNYDPEKRKLHNSTYSRIGNVTNGSLPSTTSHDQMEQSVLLKKDFEEKETRQPIISMSTLHDVNLSNTSYVACVAVFSPLNPSKRAATCRLCSTSPTTSTITSFRDTGAPNTGFGSVLPRHHSDHSKRYLDTTYVIDYMAPYPSKQSMAPPTETEMSPVWKKCHSQFTDVDDYRRHGHNTWMDESGRYANTDMKRETIKPTNTIPERLS